MDELLRYVEEELGVFGQLAREFSSRYPKPAGQLHIAGENIEDPGVARLIQSVALLSARIHKRLDDDYPKFTESLLECLYPHYLRPLPSYAVARLAQDGAAEAGEFSVLPRGSALRSAPVDGTVCHFRTVYPVLGGPLRIVRAAFTAPFAASFAAPAHAAAAQHGQPPRPPRLPRGVGACIAIEFDVRGGAAAPCARGINRVRIFVDADASLRAALLDALFIHAAGAWVQAGDGPWKALERVPLRLAGFAPDDAILPDSGRSHPAFRLLTEYFSYPEKFAFVDLDLDAVARVLAPGCAHFTLHLPLRAPAADTLEARLLAPLAAKHLLLGCTPVVNLFRKAGDPIQLSHTRAEYPLAADSAHAASYEIHSIDRVRLVREARGAASVTEFAPLYAVRHDTPGADAGHYWIARRDAALAELSPGHEVRLALVDADFRPSEAAGATVSTELTCTNRDLPSRIKPGRPEGDLAAESGAPWRLLRKPTPSWRFDARGTHWRLVSHLALNHAGLTDAGLPDLHRMLGLYDLAKSGSARRQIAGIVGLAHGSVRAWIRTRPVSTLMPGVAIRMTLDEEAFAGASLYVFAQVMDRYFALNSQLNCFTRLELVSSSSGQEILACPPRSAEQAQA
ncbi:type VI secretion system baseplate subunit TssF [Massilia sp.]|uniref:type VI secretion system baseplate subunit TssF n=1 Tax=Massilia sp. TaxID=1882437 RepID=UPI0028AD8ADD|nr:type VI secretion system baseplate subunit TssF [Massilia sp.]